MKYPRVSIIILNWNGWKDTMECLESLYKINYPNYDIIVIDNDSKDESIEKINEYCNGNIKISSKFFKYSKENKPIKVFEVNEDKARNKKFLKKDDYEKLNPNKRMILIKNKDNYGFAGGNNVGIKFSLDVLNPDYVLLLNNDTVVDKDFLIEMVKVGESDEKIGIVGSKIYYYDYNGRSDVVWFAGGGINTKTGYGWHEGDHTIDNRAYNKIKEFDFITGCSMLLKKEILEKLKGLDELYFACYEDSDLSIRAKKLGYKCVYIPKSILWHKLGVSGNGSPASVYYQTRNRILFVRKHNAFIDYILFLVWFLSYNFVKKFIYFIFLKKNFQLFKAYCKAVFDGIKGRGGKGI